MSIKICLLMGLPASGKTTLAHQLKAYLNKHDANIHVLLISYDAFIPDIDFSTQSYSEIFHHDDKQINDTTWKEYRNKVFQLVQEIVSYIKDSEAAFKSSFLPDTSNHLDIFCKCFTRIHSVTCSNFQHLILVDDNMYYRSMRYSYYQLARQFRCSFCQVYLKCDIKLLIQRNQSRNIKTVTDGTILKMADIIEAPDKCKYIWEEHSLVLTTIDEKTEDEFKKLIYFITDYSNHLTPAYTETNNEHEELDRKICLENLIHQGDQVLRKFISKKMENEKLVTKDKHVLQNLGRMLNQRRKSYLLILKESKGNDIDVYVQDGLLTEEFQQKIVLEFEGFTEIK